MALGIIDWGIGGISIYKLIKQRDPDIPVVYFYDTGVTPYGKMSRRELVTRLHDVVDYLQGHGVTRLVIGCNAASTAIPYLSDIDIPIEGVIETAVELVAKTKPKRLGLIGGRRTVISGAYRSRLKKLGVDVEQRIAQPLSALIESGQTDSPELRAEVKRILSPLKNCSHILLACTHYPAILPVLENAVSARTVFLDPATSLARKIRNSKNAARRGDKFLTSGDPQQMKRSAAKAFSVKLSNVRKVSI